MVEFILTDIIIINSAVAILFLLLVGCAIFLHIEFTAKDAECYLSSLKTRAFRNFFQR